MTMVIAEDATSVTVVSVGVTGPEGPIGPAGPQGEPGPNAIGPYAIVLGPGVENGDVLSFDSVGAVWTNAKKNQLTDGGNF